MRGMRTEVIYMNWSREEPFADKRRRLEGRIATLQQQHVKVVLIGVSAGACPAMLAYQQGRGVDAVVTVCGALHTSDTRQTLLETHLPAVADALLGWNEAEPQLGKTQRQKVLTIYSANDNLLPPKRTRLQNTQYIELQSRGHAWSIGVGLVGRIGQIKRFARFSLDSSRQ